MKSFSLMSATVDKGFADWRVALVHDWLTGMRGGEKVLAEFCDLFPHAPIFTLFCDHKKLSPTLTAHPIHTSFLQHFPGIARYYRYLLPLFPLAIQQFDLASFDWIISSSHCVAKGVRVPKGAAHLAYIHTPMRYAWDAFSDYFPQEKWGKLGTFLLERCVMSPLRQWDVHTAARVTTFIANARNIQEKIRNDYGRVSKVIYPPVDTDFFCLGEKRAADFYLIVSALVPYKRIALAIEAFNQLGYPLRIIGNGPEERHLKRLAKENITFLGWLSDEAVRFHYQQAKALIFPGEEDFGMVPVEAQACGTPVIAYGKGGALETVLPYGKATIPTGLFFYEPTVDALIDAVQQFEKIYGMFSQNNIREQVLRFGKARFREEIIALLAEAL